MSDSEVSTFVFEKYSIFEKLDTGGFKSKLSWSIRLGYPRITVYLNDPELSGSENFIVAPMKNEVMIGILDYLITLLEKNEEDFNIKLECKNKKWVADKVTDEIYTQATIEFKRVGGQNSIAIYGEKDRVVFFTIGKSIWHKLEKDNKDLTGRLDTMITVSYFKSLKNTYTTIYTKAAISDARSYTTHKTS